MRPVTWPACRGDRSSSSPARSGASDGTRCGGSSRSPRGPSATPSPGSSSGTPRSRRRGGRRRTSMTRSDSSTRSRAGPMRTGRRGSWTSPVTSWPGARPYERDAGRSCGCSGSRSRRWRPAAGRRPLRLAPRWRSGGGRHAGGASDISSSRYRHGELDAGKSAWHGLPPVLNWPPPARPLTGGVRPDRHAGESGRRPDRMRRSSLSGWTGPEREVSLRPVSLASPGPRSGNHRGRAERVGTSPDRATIRRRLRRDDTEVGRSVHPFHQCREGGDAPRRLKATVPSPHPDGPGSSSIR